MKRLLVVAGLIRGKAGSANEALFLMSRRRKNDHLGGWWEFPGGKVEPGEAPTAALRRELLEELAIDVVVGDVFAVGHHLYDDREVVLMVYDCQIAAGEPQRLEVADFRWHTPQELCAMKLPPADEPILDRVRREWGS